MSLNQDAMTQLATLLASALEGQQPANADETPVVMEQTPEMKAAAAERVKSLREYANTKTKELLDVFDDFDFETVIQIASGMAWRARDQYFFSRNTAEYHSIQLAKLQDIGARVSDDVNGEINELREKEDSIQFHNRNMEQYELFLYTAEALWLHCQRQIVVGGGEVSYIPDFDISEAAFAEWDRKRQARRSGQGRERREATRKAHRMTVDTTHHFLNPQEA